jgi:hypothetical protein
MGFFHPDISQAIEYVSKDKFSAARKIIKSQINDIEDDKNCSENDMQELIKRAHKLFSELKVFEATTRKTKYDSGTPYSSYGFQGATLFVKDYLISNYRAMLNASNKVYKLYLRLAKEEHVKVNKKELANLFDQHSLIVFSKKVIEIDKKYPFEEVKTRTLPILEKFKSGLNASVSLENNEFNRLIFFSSSYVKNLRKVEKLCSSCSGLVVSNKKWEANNQFPEYVKEQKEVIVSEREDILKTLRLLNRQHDKVFIHAANFAKKAMTGTIY